VRARSWATRSASRRAPSAAAGGPASCRRAALATAAQLWPRSASHPGKRLRAAIRCDDRAASRLQLRAVEDRRLRRVYLRCRPRLRFLAGQPTIGWANG
jgi:hypothetical protein